MISNPKVVITDYDYGDLEIEKDILHGCVPGQRLSLRKQHLVWAKSLKLKNVF